MGYVENQVGIDQLSVYQLLGINLDLALEAHDLLRGATRREIPGVKEDKQQLPFGTITTITILNQAGAQALGRPPGTYITLEAPALREDNPEVHDQIIDALSNLIRQLMAPLNLPVQAGILVVGLGNWQATPDALGPKVTDSVVVTRHLFQYAPQVVTPGLRMVSAIAPGVLGLTGIETAEIVKGVVNDIKPALVIAVDALAAGDLNRIASTIQISNTGINPGSGVGNYRTGINQETLGAPVIAIGIPTVVSAGVIIYQALQQLARMSPMLASQVNPNSVQRVSEQVLQPFGGSLTVTPREIDDLIERTSDIVASALNQALHQPAQQATSLPH